MCCTRGATVKRVPGALSLLWLAAATMMAACGEGPEAVSTSPLTLHKADVNGDKQVDTVFATLTSPLRVIVRRGNDPVEGIVVRWGQRFPAFSFLPETTRTDESGIAEFRFTLGPWACHEHADHPVGTYLVEAFLAEADTRVFFSARAYPGNPVRLGAGGGDQQVGLPNTVLADYEVYASDRRGNTVAGVTVDWGLKSGGGPLSRGQSVTSGSPGPCGGSASATYTLGPDRGAPDTVSATATALPDAEVTLTSTSVSALRAVLSDGFGEDTIVVRRGETVGWIWQGNYCDAGECWEAVAHNVTFDDAPAPPASSQTQAFGTHTRTLTQPGVYPYHCTEPHYLRHPGGVVVVR